MEITILNDIQYQWSSSKISTSIDIWFRGTIWIKNRYFTAENACKHIADHFELNGSNPLTAKDVTALLADLTGNFSFIIKTASQLLAVVDRIRSYPIYYTQVNNRYYVSNSAYEIKESGQLSEINEEASLIFQMAGYCLGQDTLISKIKQIESSCYLLLDTAKNEVNYEQYFQFLAPTLANRSESQLIEELHHVTEKTFSKMVETLDGKPVWLPLSGGYDSRLILTLLQKFKYDNLVSYSYGDKNMWECKRAQFVAEKLNAKWTHVLFETHKVKKYYHQTDRKRYYRFASGLNSAPHVAEYYALIELRKKGVIPDDAIIINGQSGDFTSGGHIPKFLMEHATDNVGTQLFMDTLVNKHFSLWQNLKTNENKALLKTRILKSLNLLDKENLTREEFAKNFEYHECHERQVKFVINGQRAYDWFGYDWRLPLWSDELMDFWRQVDWRTKFGQGLYLKYLEHYNFGGVFKGIELPKQYSYYPTWAKIIKPLFSIAGRISSKEINYQKKYLSYFMAYAPYFPQQSYWEFLKDSEWHRNTVSYWVKYVLNEL